MGETEERPGHCHTRPDQLIREIESDWLSTAQSQSRDPVLVCWTVSHSREQSLSCVSVIQHVSVFVFRGIFPFLEGKRKTSKQDLIISQRAVGVFGAALKFLIKNSISACLSLESKCVSMCGPRVLQTECLLSRQGFFLQPFLISSPALSFSAERVAINTESDRSDPCSHSLKSLSQNTPPHTHTHKPFQRVHTEQSSCLVEIAAGSALLVPVARAVISGPKGSVRACVLQCAHSWMLVCLFLLGQQKALTLWHL